MLGMTTRWFLGMVMGGALALSTNCAFAQIIPDGTLPNNSIVTPQGNTSLIEGGIQAGSNLFHSFSEFSVSAGGTAFFNNAGDIQNIISRVTGGSISNIDGLIRANGTANVFLINPNGIIFGPNASLDIGGSFLASTSSSLNFADSTKFSTTNPEMTPLLTISVPIGLQFGATAGNIRVEGSDLRVQPGKTLALVGGDVTLHGDEGAALKRSNLVAPGGRIELGGVAVTGTVGLNFDSNNVFLSFSNNPAEIKISAQELFLSYPDNLAKANISAHQSSIEGNSIQLQGKHITLTGGSNILATDSSFLNLLTGNPITYVESPQGGNVIINAETLNVLNGSQVVAVLQNRFSVSRAKLTITASNSVEVSGTGVNIFGRIGESTIRVGSLNNVSEELTISTKSLIAQDGGKIIAFAARNDRQGGGTLTINASDSVELTGISKERFSGFTLLNDFSKDSRSISGIFSTVFNVGDAGNINVNTKRLLIQDGARISASTFSIGKAGNININASDSVELNGTSADGLVRSGLFATSDFSSGGNITIKTGQLSVQNRARVNVATEPTPEDIQFRITPFGSAGNIDIQADNIRFNNQAVLNANSFSGAGGNISLQAEHILLLQRNSLISATSGTPGNTGQDGNINVNTKFLIAVPSENSDIVATGFGRSPGSNIQVNAQGIFGTQFRQQQTLESDIVASGNVTLNIPDIEPNSGLVNLPSVPVDTKVVQGCTAGASQTQSKFFITGRGGLPPNPGDFLSTDAVQVDLVTLNSSIKNRSALPVTSKTPKTAMPERIVEATGIVMNENGEIVLTTNASTAAPHSSWFTPAHCKAS